MASNIDPKLKSAVERYVRQRFPDTILDGITIEEGFDVDGDPIVNVIVALRERPQAAQVNGLARKLWGALARENFGFPILSFRSPAEVARLSAVA